jgi:outer membrane immunogenic protein
MKKLFLAGVALAVLSAGAAAAADLPRRSAPVAPAPVVAAIPVFTWTGFYAGVNGGYAFGEGSRRLIDTTTGATAVVSGDDEGFIGGGQVGFNYQIGTFVVGLETDIQYADLGGEDQFTVGGTTFRTRGSDNYFGTLRGRAGLAFDRFMVYGTGGLAYGDVGSFGTEGVGWTAGGGVEYAFTNNITAKVEGLYVSLDRNNDAYVIGGNSFTPRGNEEFGLVRAGLNFKF